MTTRTKIDVHAGTLSMEFGDTLVQFNIFQAMKHPIEDHSLFGIDLIDELVEECLQLDSSNEGISNFAKDIDSIGCLGSLPEEVDYDESDPKESNDNSSSLPPSMELKPLPSHLKYAYLDVEQQFPIIIASNLHREQEDKLLSVLRQHKKAIGWKLSDLSRIKPSICMYRILMQEEGKPIRQQQRRMTLTILDVVKKEVTKLLTIGIICLISNSQWVRPVQVVPKKSGMTVTKN
ncbi:hypothetical protein CR513_05058, partial [Mucuna pruriens]